MDDTYNMLQQITNILNTFLEANKKKDINSQKIIVLLVIIEFIRCGANIRMLPIQNMKVPIIIELKEENKNGRKI